MNISTKLYKKKHNDDVPFNPYNLRSYAYKFGLAASLLRLY